MWAAMIGFPCIVDGYLVRARDAAWLHFLLRLLSNVVVVSCCVFDVMCWRVRSVGLFAWCSAVGHVVVRCIALVI